MVTGVMNALTLALSIDRITLFTRRIVQSWYTHIGNADGTLPESSNAQPSTS